MSNITYSPRNTPTVTQGTVEPIKLQATTHGAVRSQVGMAPRAPQTASTASLPTEAPAAPIETPKSPAVSEDPQLSAKFAALARKEKAIRQRQEEIGRFQAEKEQMSKELADLRSYKQRFESDKLGFLNEQGVTYDQLVQLAVNPADKNMTTMQQQIKQLEDTIKKQNEDFQKGAETQREQALRQISADVTSLINSDPQYETVKEMNAGEAITQLISTTYDEDGILLTTEQAAKQVNDYLVSEAERIAGIPSIKKRLQPATPVAQQIQVPSTPQKNTIRTLSNTMVASDAPPKNWAEKKARIVAKYSKQS